MRMMVRAAAIGAAMLAGGCATIMEGTTQQMVVDMVPDHGTCEVSRQGQKIATSMPGQRVLEISKSQHDLTFSCSAAGYTPKVDTLSSTLAAATVASFLLLDFGIVDAATGAWMKYPTRVTIVLQKAPGA